MVLKTRSPKSSYEIIKSSTEEKSEEIILVPPIGEPKHVKSIKTRVP